MTNIRSLRMPTQELKQLQSRNAEILRNSFAQLGYNNEDLRKSMAPQMPQTNSYNGGVFAEKIGSKNYQDYLTDQPTNPNLNTSEIKQLRQSLTNNLIHSESKNSKNAINFKTIQHEPNLIDFKSSQYSTIEQQHEIISSQKKNRMINHSLENFNKQKRHASPKNRYKVGGATITKEALQNDDIKLDHQALFEKVMLPQDSRFLNARTQVQVPKDLILMKISKRQMELRNQELQSEQKYSLFQTSDIQPTSANKRRFPLSLVQSVGLKSTRLNPLDESYYEDGSSQLNLESFRENRKFSKQVNVLDQKSDLKSLSNLQHDISYTGTGTQNSQGYNIIDLIKQSTTDRSASNVQASLDYYKRSIKTDGELKIEREVLIKNYRLRVVDAAKDITPEDRRLMLLNKGTSIYVSNSLIKPETYRCSTNVSNAMAEVLYEMAKKPDLVYQSSNPVVNQNFKTVSSQDKINSIKANKEKQQVYQSENTHIDLSKSISNPQYSQSEKVIDQNQEPVQLSNQIQYEKQELQAIIIGQMKIDLWFPKTQSSENDLSFPQQQNQQQFNPDAGRYILENGSPAPLTHSEIVSRMRGTKVSQIEYLHPRENSIDQLTAVTKFLDLPYLYLMRTIIVPKVRNFSQQFVNKTTKFIDQSCLLKSHQNPIVQLVDYNLQLEAYNFVRVEYTHLDPHLIQDVNLNQDLFFQQDLVYELQFLLASKPQDEIVQAKIEYMFVSNGRHVQELVDFEAVSYDEKLRVFNLYNRNLNVWTTRSRFNLQLKTDSPQFIKQNREHLEYWKDQYSLQFLRVSRLIQAEMIRRYNNHQMNDDFRTTILRLCGDITKYERYQVERLIVQIEALYVYSIMRATLSSERNDPFVKKMLINFQIAMDSPALVIEKQNYKIKEQLGTGIFEFRMQAIKNELGKASLTISSQKYMQLTKLLHSITVESIYSKNQSMFLTPIPAQTLIYHGDKQFSKLLPKQVDFLVNSYPLEHTKWIEGQKVMQEQFQKLLKTQWSEVIAQEIWFYIQEDFEFDTLKSFTERQIDPNLLKILYQIKQYQTTILHEAFERGIREYIRFLLGFALRDQEIKRSKIIATIRITEQLRLINVNPGYLTPAGTDANDLELIRLQLKPLVKVHFEVQVSGKMRNRKYKVISVPEIDTIQKDFLSIIKSLHDSTKHLRRIDAILFPALSLANQFIPQPDIKNNTQLIFVNKLISKLLKECMEGCRKKIINFQQYNSIFEKKVDGIIPELKKKSFTIANEGSEEDTQEKQKLISPSSTILKEDQQEEQVSDLASPQIFARKSLASEESYDDEEEEDDEEEGAIQSNAMAYKLVEIDHGLMRVELEAIRLHKYRVMQEVSHSYDFGMLWIDCKPFKTFVIDHCIALENEITNYLKEDFGDKMKNIQTEISMLKGRLDQNVTSIDDVISLLDYIETLKDQGNKVKEISDYIDLVTKTSDFIDSIRIILPEEMKINFLHMRNWPKKFDTWISNRKNQLIQQKLALIESMKVETENVFLIVDEFKKKIQELEAEGLIHQNTKQNEERQKQIAKMLATMNPAKALESVIIEIPFEITFQWLAVKINYNKQKFDSKTVVHVYEQLSELKQRFEDLDKLTVLINKRQQLLGVQQTEFREQKKILDNLKPLHELWDIANVFKVLIVQWFEEPFEKLDSNVMENQIEEWLIELRRLEKTEIIQKNLKPHDFLKYMSQSLDHVKQYQTLVRITRVKGLNSRHWRQINAELKIFIDPNHTTLLQMIGMGLLSKSKIKQIKTISDVAQKEYAIQVQTDSLEKEMKTVEFQFMTGHIPDVKILKKVEAILSKFNELLLRVQVLKTNPYVRNFFDRLLEIEKTVKSVLELVSEFEIFQNKWLQLSRIFYGGSLSSSFSNEIKLWSAVDKFFLNTIKSLHEAPQVHIISSKDGLLASLKKYIQEVEQCRDGLNRILETKRQLFPRLYFVSDEELLNIFSRQQEIIDAMAEGNDNSFLHTIYQGIIKPILNPKNKAIVSILSKNGEQVNLHQQVNTGGVSLENWLAKFEYQITTSMRKMVLLAYQDMDRDLPIIPEEPKELNKFKKTKLFRIRKVSDEVLLAWISTWPGQATYVSQQMWFTQKIQSLFESAEKNAKYAEKKRYYEKTMSKQKGYQKRDDSSSENSDPYQSDMEKDEDEHGQATGDHEQNEEDETASKSLIQEASQPSIKTTQIPDDDQLQSTSVLVENADQKQSGKNTKPQKSKSRLSVPDRAMRLWDRFCINDMQHPADTLGDMKSTVIQKINYMISYLNQKLSQHVYASCVALITCCVYQRDQLQNMIDQRQFKITDFEWQIQLKFNIDKLVTVFKNIFPFNLDAAQQKWENKLEFQELTIRLDVFNLNQSYGFQYLGNAQRLVITPLTTKAQRGILMALQNQFGCAVEGSFSSGKTETIQDLSNALARHSHIVNTSIQYNNDEVFKFFKGIAACGAWVSFDEFNRMDLQMMNYVTQLISQLQNAIRQQRKQLLIEEQRINIENEFSIFITLNPGYKTRVELPANLKTIFRPITMLMPDWSLITKILLIRYGFSEAHELSQKIIYVQKSADALMQEHLSVRKDFGLRTIRAIINFAVSLKLQCQNFQLSEMTDIINDNTMANINWEKQRLINDVIQDMCYGESQPQIFFGSPSDPSIIRMQPSSKENLVSGQGQITFSDRNLINNSATSSIIMTPDLLENIDKQSEADSYNQQIRFKGQFFEQAFKSDMSRFQRQIQTLYKQIGILGGNPSRQEVEECIIIKAVRDFNYSKFAEHDYDKLDGIISDVFDQKQKNSSGKLLDGQSNSSNHKNVRKSDYGNLRELLLQQMTSLKLDKNSVLEHKCYQMFEIMQIRRGCILLGQTQSAKSTLIQTLAGALNSASQNELKLRIAEQRKQRLMAEVISCPQVNQLLPAAALQRFETQIQEAQRSNTPIQVDHVDSPKMRLTQMTHPSQQSGEFIASQNGFPQNKGKKNKLSEKQKMALWQDLYSKTKLDILQVFALEQELVMRGVKLQRINPKSISKSELIGEVLSESGAWNEGLLIQQLREFSHQKSSLKKWIHLDGPIDHDWAENLNSLLDENNKISLPNGDVIQIDTNTCIIFETDNLNNLTPASISRCGLVYLNRPNTNNPKQIFNQYLSRFPPNLTDSVREIEAQVNWLIPSCFQVLNEEKQRGTLLITKSDEFWVIQNFIKVFDSFIQSYWIDFIKDNKSDFEDAPQQAALKNCLHAHGYQQSRLDIIAQLQEDTIKLNPEVLEAEFRAMKIESACSEVDGDERIAHNDFTVNDTRIENSVKFMPLWIEAFVLTAITLTFGSILSQQARNHLGSLLKIKIEERKGDFAAYQKFKKKMSQANEEKKKKEKAAQQKSMVGMSSSKTKFAGFNNSSSNLVAKLSSQNDATNKSSQNLQSIVFTSDFVESIEEMQKPMFITDFPFTNEHGLNIFDFYFNLNTNQWTRFDDTHAQAQMQKVFGDQSYSMQNVVNLRVPSMQWMKFFYQMECLIIAQKPILVSGEGATGKSTLVKEMLFNQMKFFTKKVVVDHVTCTYRTDQITLKEQMQRNLQIIKLRLVKSEQKSEVGDSDTEKPMPTYQSKIHDSDIDPQRLTSPVGARPSTVELLQEKMEKEQDPRVMRPYQAGVCLLIYLEDIHLSNFDEFQDNSAMETLRDLIQYNRWYSSGKNAIRKVESVNLISCLNNKYPQKSQISDRLLRLFSVIGLEVLNAESCFSIINRMLEINAIPWISQMQGAIPNVSKAVFELYQHCSKYLRPSPLKMQFTFNQREIFKLVASICQVESNFIKGMQNICKLFFHEAMRQFGDRILMKHDLKWFIRTCKAVCSKHFLDKDIKNFDFSQNQQIEDEKLFEDFPVKEPENLWFSQLNYEQEGYYLESAQPKKIRGIMEKWIERYNEQPDIKKLNLVLYDELYRNLFQILRAITIQSTHLIIVGLRGFATQEIIKLAALIAQQQYCSLEMNSDFNDLDWKQELRRKVIETGKDDKQICFILEEHRITNQEWYKDIESLMTCNALSPILLSSDVPSMLSGLKLTHLKQDRQPLSTISNVELKKEGEMTSAQIENLDKNKKDEESTKKINLNSVVKENVKQIQSNPNLTNKLYQLLLSQVRRNLHLILTFTPSGQTFRNKMQLYPQLMYNSYIIWTQNLMSQDLVQIGEQIFVNELEIELKFQLSINSARDSRLDKITIEDARDTNQRVLNSMVQIYLITQKFSKSYKENYQHSLYFTPVFFLRSLQVYRRLLTEQKNNVNETLIKYQKGLDQLKDTIVKVETYKQDLDNKIPILVQSQQKLVAVICDIQAEIDRLNEKKISELEEEKLTTGNTIKAQKNFEECQAVLYKFAPALDNSLKHMQKINRLEIAELRSMKHPPRLVKLVMTAICILLDVEPVQKESKTGQFKMSYWRAAIGPHVLANPNLPGILENFDAKKISQEKMAKVEEFIADPDYTLELIIKSAATAECLYNWIKAQRDHYYLFNELGPRKNEMEAAEAEYNQAKKISHEQRIHIEGIQQNLTILNELLQEKTQAVEELTTEIDDKNKRVKRSIALLSGLQLQKQKWVVCSRMLNNNSQTVYGDVVLAAALISYGGGFIFSQRRSLVKNWQNSALKHYDLITSENFQLQELLGDNFKIRKWHDNGLPKDILSTDNALIMDNTKQYVVCIDPQQQALMWLKNQNQKNGIITIKFNDPQLKRQLETAIEMGKLVVVDHVPETIDISIESLVKKEISKHGDAHMIMFCRKQLKLDLNFGLILVTRIQKPHFDVVLTNYTTLVNFYVTKEGISQILLNLIVANERTNLEDDYNTSVDQTFRNVKNLKEVEGNLLQRLEEQSVHEILSNETCIEILKKSSQTSEIIAEHIRRIHKKNQQLVMSFGLYTPVALRAATLYAGIQELSQVNSMYIFGLPWFLSLFKQIMQTTNPYNKSGSKDSKEEYKFQNDVTFDNSNMLPEKRVELLMTAFTQDIIRKVSQSVFLDDRQLIIFFLTLKVIHSEQLSDTNLISFAINGLKNLTEPSQNLSSQNKVGWINDVVWFDIQNLSTLKPFTHENLSQHILDNTDEWYFIQNAPHIQFDELPNNNLIDLNQFIEYDKKEDDLQELQSKQNPILQQRQQSRRQQTRQEQRKQYTEQEILEDDTLWIVSDSENDEEHLKLIKQENLEDQDKFLAEEERYMMKFMADKPPGMMQGLRDVKKFNKRIGKLQKHQIIKLELLRRTVVLCIAKCMRPDLVLQCLYQLVATIYDFKLKGPSSESLQKLINADGTLKKRKPHQRLSDSQPWLDNYIESKEVMRESNIYVLLEEAFQDSTCQKPVLFFMSNSVDIHKELNEFHYSLHIGVRVVSIECDKTCKDQLKKIMRDCINGGDWVLIQNLHLEPTWIEILEEYIQSLNSKTNPKFRLWISTEQLQNCSETLLKACIKVGLQFPLNIKSKLERHLMDVKEGTFQRENESVTLQKNLYLGLSYLHGILDGRRAYRSFGWNEPYLYDKNDFQVSETMMTKYIEEEFSSKVDLIRTFKYALTSNNFAGKISHAEDERKMSAIVEDLFNEELMLENEFGPDLDSSHYGFYSKDVDILYRVQADLAQFDEYRIFGFNKNIWRQNQKTDGLQICARLMEMNNYEDLNFDLHNKIKRYGLERGNYAFIQESQLVKLFEELQKVVRESSCETGLSADSDIHEETIPTTFFSLRDKADTKVAQILNQIKSKLSDFVLTSPPTNNNQLLQPVDYVILKELDAFSILRNVMIETVNEFLMYIGGQSLLPNSAQMLWNRIQINLVPAAWLKASYKTAHTSLAHFIADFEQKIKFWNSFIITKFALPVYQISAFFETRQFLQAKIQQHARLNRLQAHRTLNQFKVTQFINPSQAQEFYSQRLKNNQCSLLYGLWLEGADWDLDTQMLAEQKDGKIHSPFPVLELTQIQIDESVLNNEDRLFFNDNPKLTKEEKRIMLSEQKRQESSKIGYSKTLITPSSLPELLTSGAETPFSRNQTTEFNIVGGTVLSSKMYFYKCPVYSTSSRKCVGDFGQESDVLFYVELKSNQKPLKWVKRSVALLMEPTILE